MKQEGYITPSLHITKHDISSLAPPKWGDEKYFQLDFKHFMFW